MKLLLSVPVSAAAVLVVLTSAVLSGPDAIRARADLNSADPELRSDGCLALIAEGELAIGFLEPLLNDPSLLVRHTAAYALARIGGPGAEKIFKEGLSAPGDDRRRISVLGLGMLGRADRAGIAPLLQDKNWEVRWSAAYVLGRSGDRRDLALLGDLARNDPYCDPASGFYPVRAAAEKSIKRLNSVIGWQTDLQAARELSGRTGRPLLLYFRSGGSDLCRQFERKIFTDEKIIDTAQRMVPVWLDHAAAAQTFPAWRVTRVPVTIIAAPDNSRRERIDGTTRPEALLDRMLALLETEKSALRLRSRLEKSPSDLETAWQLAAIYLEGGMGDGARQMLNRIIERDPDNLSSLLDNALFARAYLEGQRGDYHQSAREIDDILARFPVFGDRAEALYCGGLAHLRAGNPVRGRELLELLRKDYPDGSLAGAAGDILSGLDGRGEKPAPGR
jgi:tetratricopeptide (TPR) repeat protein